MSGLKFIFQKLEVGSLGGEKKNKRKSISRTRGKLHAAPTKFGLARLLKDTYVVKIGNISYL